MVVFGRFYTYMIKERNEVLTCYIQKGQNIFLDLISH